jgi:peroxiredoxin Q/BCP
MRYRRPLYLLTTVGFAATAIGSRAAAQQPQAAAPSTAPDVGQVAPDFTLPGASRYGLLRDPFHLADHRGETVVLAFFPKARTKG